MSMSLWMSQNSKAQRYREKYTDLVTIQNEQQTVQLTDMVNDDSTDLAWIGFYDDLNSWKWTLEDSVGEKDICYYIYVIYSRDICYYIYTVCVCVCVCYCDSLKKACCQNVQRVQILYLKVIQPVYKGI